MYAELETIGLWDKKMWADLWYLLYSLAVHHHNQSREVVYSFEGDIALPDLLSWVEEYSLRQLLVVEVGCLCSLVLCVGLYYAVKVPLQVEVEEVL